MFKLTYSCKQCGKEFESSKSLGAHKSHCLKSQNRKNKRLNTLKLVEGAFTERWSILVNNGKLYPTYEISTWARVRNVKTQNILKPQFDRAGYAEYWISDKDVKTGVKVLLAHRLVAQAFLDNPDNKSFVNHQDGNKANCTLENLVWSTPKENAIHAHDVLNCNIGRVYVLCIETGEVFNSKSAAAKFAGVTSDGINYALLYNMPTGGYHFELREV